MTTITNNVDAPAYDFVSGLRMPELRAGIVAPNGDAEPFKNLPIGSQYLYANDKNPEVVKHYTKLANEQRDDDWSMGVHCIQQRVAFGDFTDGTAAVGTLVLTEGIPAGAWVLRTVLQDLTGFTGDTSCVLTVGDGTDVDRYNTGTPSIFTTAVAVDMAAPSGVQIHVLAKSVTLTATSATDWGAVAAGAFTIRIYYLL